jgi:uncharacterized membrane protein YdbT with pleckstrin-like domain
MGFPQRLLADDEQLVLVLRRHIKVLLVPFVIFVLVVSGLGLTVLLPAAVAPWSWLVAGALGAVVLTRWTLWPLLVWFNTQYAITTRRLILRSGVFNRAGHDMPLSRLNDVSFNHNLVERMLRCGTLVVESAGEQGQLRLDDVPKVELVQRTLYRLSDDLRGVQASELDEGLARSLDEAFDEEYRGPAGDGQSGENRS